MNESWIVVGLPWLLLCSREDDAGEGEDQQ